MSGAASLNRGKWTEQAFVRWARGNGFNGAERTVRTGYAVAGREFADRADVDLCPGAVAAVKSLRPANRMERAVPGWLAETEAQRMAAGADVALLVVRRDGTADVGEWFAWLAAVSIGVLPAGALVSPAAVRFPVRLLVADACRLLRAAGYGDPLEVTL